MSTRDRFADAVRRGAAVLLSLFLVGCAGVRARACCPAPVVGAAPIAEAPSVAKAPPVAEAASVSESPTQPTSESPADGYALYAGGKRVTLAEVLRAAEDSALVAFGEHHGHPVGNGVELQLLEGLAAQKAPVALALEFFERDTQPALDAYLAGTLDEAAFLKRTRQKPAYATTHRPLIEFCKANGIHVIAANAPRPLVTAYRKSDVDYPAYRKSLGDEDRAALPAATSIIEDRHHQRFMQMMGGARGARLFRAMALWDDAMADNVATYQKAHPATRVLLIVGAFHVTERLGTITKYLQRRPDAQVTVLVMARSTEATLPLGTHEQALGDVVMKVMKAPRP